jgi:hypothetical protein
VAPESGFRGDPLQVTHYRGVRIDRHEGRGGTSTSPEGTPFGERALPSPFETAKPYEAELRASFSQLIANGHLVPVES